MGAKVRALSIRQPFAELILRGVKTVEYRSRPTRIVGERFLLYASKQKAAGSRQIWSHDLSNTGGTPVPQWMIELAEQIKLLPPGIELPRGVIVGSAVIEKCVEVEGTKGHRDEGTEGRNTLSPGRSVPLSLAYAWHLADIQRARQLRKPRNRPQPVWFVPF